MAKKTKLLLFEFKLYQLFPILRFMFAGQYILLMDKTLSVLVHTPSHQRILIWDILDHDFIADYTMNYVYVAFGSSLFVLETGELPDHDDRLLTYAALWYANYNREKLSYVGLEDPRLQKVG